MKLYFCHIAHHSSVAIAQHSCVAIIGMYTFEDIKAWVYTVEMSKFVGSWNCKSTRNKEIFKRHGYNIIITGITGCTCDDSDLC